MSDNIIDINDHMEVEEDNDLDFLLYYSENEKIFNYFEYTSFPELGTLIHRVKSERVFITLFDGLFRGVFNKDPSRFPVVLISNIFTVYTYKAEFHLYSSFIQMIAVPTYYHDHQWFIRLNKYLNGSNTPTSSLDYLYNDYCLYCRVCGLPECVSDYYYSSFC